MASSGQVMGIISAVALSFIVHEPSGIIGVDEGEVLASRRGCSGASRLGVVRLKTGWVRKAGLARVRPGGRRRPAGRRERLAVPSIGRLRRTVEASVGLERGRRRLPWRLVEESSHGVGVGRLEVEHARRFGLGSSARRRRPSCAGEGTGPARVVVDEVDRARGRSPSWTPTAPPLEPRRRPWRTRSAIARSPWGRGTRRRDAAMFASSACAVQMLDVALSRRMCCSRVCIAMRSAGVPVASMETPMMRPGMSRAYFVEVAR